MAASRSARGRKARKANAQQIRRTSLRYKGYEIDQTTTRISDGMLTHVAYSILLGGTEVYREILNGPFSIAEAEMAIESAARQWIDRQQP